MSAPGPYYWTCACGKHDVRVFYRHPMDPAKDRVRCADCDAEGVRYEFTTWKPKGASHG